MLIQQNAAMHVIADVLSGRNLTESLAATLQRHPQLDAGGRGAVQDLSYGTLRHLGLLRAVLKQLVRQQPDFDIEILLLLSLYQLEFTKNAPYAVVDHAVELTGELTNGRAGGFVNACLRRFQREREALIEHARRSSEGQWSHPYWWIDRVKKDWPDQWQQILETANGRAPMTLRVNRRHDSAEGYLLRLRAAGLDATVLGPQALRLENPVGVSALPGFADGHASVQDWGAQAAAGLLDLRDGQRVLDACAAPGGKTAHILELVDVELLALDHDELRLQRVRDTLQRLGLKADVKQGDASAPQHWWDGRPFDRILADVPCSASGVSRRHPDIKWLRRSKDINAFAAQQQSILQALWTCLAPGGRLLYATCSIFHEENSQQVGRFLEQNQDARQIPLAFSGMVDGQLLPDGTHDGFYYAALEKLAA